MKIILKTIIFVILIFTNSNCSDKKDSNENNTISSKPSIDNTLAKGKELFEGKGVCTTCHKPNAKIVGPSLSEISKIYKEKNASIVSFLKEESKPIVDPSQYEIMKTNFSITKTMSDEELKAIEKYVLSF